MLGAQYQRLGLMGARFSSSHVRTISSTVGPFEGSKTWGWALGTLLSKIYGEVPMGAMSILMGRLGRWELTNFMTPATPVTSASAPFYAVAPGLAAVPHGRDVTSMLLDGGENNDELFGDASALVMSSTMKKRAMKMNKHKLKKRRKALRMNTKRSRG